ERAGPCSWVASLHTWTVLAPLNASMASVSWHRASRPPRPKAARKKGSGRSECPRHCPSPLMSLCGLEEVPLGRPGEELLQLLALRLAWDPAHCFRVLTNLLRTRRSSDDTADAGLGCQPRECQRGFGDAPFLGERAKGA